MRKLISNRPIEDGRLIVPIRVNTIDRATNDAIRTEAKIDTGMCIGSNQDPVGLVLLKSDEHMFHGALERMEGCVQLVLPERTTVHTLSYRIEIQFVGDKNQIWPVTPIYTRAVFLERSGPPLIGFGLWDRWQMEIDGPGERFSIWVPK